MNKMVDEYSCLNCLKVKQNPAIGFVLDKLTSIQVINSFLIKKGYSVLPTDNNDDYKFRLFWPGDEFGKTIAYKNDIIFYQIACPECGQYIGEFVYSSDYFTGAVDIKKGVQTIMSHMSEIENKYQIYTRKKANKRKVIDESPGLIDQLFKIMRIIK